MTAPVRVLGRCGGSRGSAGHPHPRPPPRSEVAQSQQPAPRSSAAPAPRDPPAPPSPTERARKARRRASGTRPRARAGLTSPRPGPHAPTISSTSSSSQSTPLALHTEHPKKHPPGDSALPPFLCPGTLSLARPHPKMQDSQVAGQMLDPVDLVLPGLGCICSRT